MAKQDWSPRRPKDPWSSRLVRDPMMLMSEHAWWDYVGSLREEIGPDMFVHLVARKARRWDVREKFIRELAWNDHNSEWHLQLDSILRTRRFREGDPASAEAVAQSLDAMLG